MKTTAPNTKLLAILTFLALFNLDAAAHTTRSRELCGTISSLDLSNQLVEVKSERSGKVMDLVLRREARFLKDWKLSSIGAITEGVRACVYYRSPFFGKPFITKVVVLNEGDRFPPHGGR